MIYGYPVSATSGNWLHKCLVTMLESIHEHIDAGVPLPTWLEIIPEEYRDKLSSRIGLQSRFDRYMQVITGMSAQERVRIITAMRAQNNIANLLSCVCDCDRLDELPGIIRPVVADIFDFAYRLLTDLEIRDEFYIILYNDIPYHVCAFCGCAKLKTPGSRRRQTLDHYLANSKYPFAAANLRNLAPMCDDCNSGPKLADDILRNVDGTRCKAFDPYNAPGVAVSLDNSHPSDRIDEPLIIWQITFNGDVEKVHTWESVFSIRARYEHDEINPSLNDWLIEFSSWCKYRSIRDASDAGVINAINQYIEFLNANGLNERAFLKAAVFHMLLLRFREGNESIVLIMRALLIGDDSNNTADQPRDCMSTDMLQLAYC